MSSDNPSGADNQQERPGIEEWIVGFVDGEGCFSMSGPAQPEVWGVRYQVQPVFGGSRTERSVAVLEKPQTSLVAESIYRNREA